MSKVPQCPKCNHTQMRKHITGNAIEDYCYYCYVCDDQIAKEAILWKEYEEDTDLAQEAKE